MMNWPKIIETNSDDEGSVETLSEQLRQQKQLTRQATQSCEHYKKINESLLAAMTQMTQERKGSKLEKEREKELERREKLAEQTIRQMSMKLESANSKATLLEKAKEQLQNTLQQFIRENAVKTQTIRDLMLEVQSLRMDLIRQQNKEKIVAIEHHTSHDPQLVSQLQQLKQRYASMEFELRNSFETLLSEKTALHQDQKSQMQSRLNALQFQLNLLHSQMEQLRKENTSMKKMLAESTIKNYESMEQHQKDFLSIHKKSSHNLDKLQQKIKMKDAEVIQLTKQLASLKTVMCSTREERDQLKTRVAQLQKLLNEAKLHIVSVDLENKNIKRSNRDVKKSRVSRVEDSRDMRSSQNDQNLSNLLLSLESRSSQISTDCMSRNGSRKDFGIDKPILRIPNTMR